MSRSIEIDAGQVLIAGFSGQEPPASALQAAAGGRLAGFILFERNIDSIGQVVELNRRLSKAAPADYPLWTTVDQEGGRVARLGPPVVRLPPMRVLGSLGRPELTFYAARLLGRQMRELGFNLNLAPVLDVDTNEKNPVIGDRAFGRDSATVASHGAAFIRGVQEAGIAACAKHFPGHGDTELDSHLALPRLTHDRKRLEEIELAPFRAAIPYVSAIMTAHVVFEAIDPRSPATLSRAVITGLLREELGFQGVVISDAMEMKAVADHYGAGEAACAAIEAGCDALLMCSDVESAFSVHEALVRRAEKDGRFADMLAQAARRSLAARRRLAAGPPAARAPWDERSFIQESRAMELRIDAAISALDLKGA